MTADNFVIDLIEGLLADSELGLTEQNVRFYDKGVVPGEGDAALADHISWKNARYLNEDSSTVLSSTLTVQLPIGTEGHTEYISFSMEELSQTYRKGGLDGVLSAVVTSLKECKINAEKTAGALEHFAEYEEIKNRLILRPLNYDDNEQILKHGIYRRVGDMALVLYISLGGGKQGSSANVMSTMVSRELFLLWGVGEDEEEVLNWAMDNTMRLQPPVFCVISLPAMKIQHIPFMDGAEEIEVDFDIPMAPVLSTEQEINGAIAAFYPGVLERLHQMVGEDFYLVFTSIYDVHIHPISGKVRVETMRDCLSGMNKEINKREELLSRRIYRYNTENRDLVVI
ncbi:DUF5688 family protein [Oscillospiraceae bacterium 50-16]